MGYAIASGGHKAVYLAAASLLALVFAIIVVTPTVGLYAAAVLLGGWAEAPQDNRLLPGWGYVYAHGTRVSILEVLLYLTFAALLVRGQPRPPRPLAAAWLLVVVVLVRVHSQGDLHAARPMMLVAVSGCVGYWMAATYGRGVVEKALVVAASAACVTGLFNHFSGGGLVDRGHILSSYDSASVFLVGAGALLLFYACPFPRLPTAARYALIAAGLLDIALSLRRGAIAGLLLALLLLVCRERRYRRRLPVLALVAATISVAVAFVDPGVFGSEYHMVRSYLNLTGSDDHVLYRQYETSNIIENVRHHWLWGIGPTSNWQLFNTFGERYVPYNLQYAHNTYLYLWLRYGVVGIACFLAFLVLAVKHLNQRWRPGAVLIVGVALASLTASFLPTTFRWPVLVGLLIGAGLSKAPSEPAGGR
jgi:hypothetical protein